jgi:IS5 family transposase
MKVHAGVDKDSGLIHLVVVTAANVQNLTPAADLLHGDEKVVDDDAGYQGIANRPEMAGKTMEFRVAMRPSKCRVLPDPPQESLQDLIETAKAHIRSKVEHPFRVIFAKPAGGRSSSSAFRRPGCVAWPRTAARSTCWRHCRICFKPVGNFSRQRDQGHGVFAHLDSASKPA